MKVIYVNKAKATFTKKNGYAIYVGFPYDIETYRRLEQLPYFYLAHIDRYEIHIRDRHILKHIFSDYNIITDDKKFAKDIAEYKERNKNILTTNQRSDVDLKTSLFKHQQEAIDFSRDKSRFLLADDMGLGKTLSALSIALTHKHQFKHTLIVCGVNALKWNWLEEIEEHTHEKGHILGSRINTNGRLVVDGVKERLEDLKQPHDEFFLITNMETLRDVGVQNAIEDLIQSGELGMTIIDEVHKMKTPDTKVGKAIHRLDTYYKIGLSGTPLINTPLDLYNILVWLGYQPPKTKKKFEYKYCIFGGFANTEIVGYRNLDHLKELLNNIQLRRRKEEILDLPEKTYTTVYVELKGKQKKLYEQVENELIQNINEIMLSNNPLAKISRLRQITSYPAILEPDIGIGSKMEQVIDTAEELISQGHKLIVYSNWTKVTNGLLKELEHHQPLEITGKVSDEKRNRNKLEFQNNDDRRVVIGTIGAMGTGITLTEADYILFIDVPWTNADKEQAIDRAHRMGTDHPVNILTFVTKDTVDERIENIVYGKKRLSYYVVDNIDTYTPKEKARLLLGLELK